MFRPLKPLQFFTNLDLAVPGILVHLVAFARKDQQLRRNTLGVQGALQKIGFADVDSNVIGRRPRCELESSPY